MKAILMAAGVGSRMRDAFVCPKCTLDVGGIPLIAKTVDMLLAEGIEVAIVTGYKYWEVEACLRGRDVTIYRNPFFRVTNSMASLWFAKDFIGEDDLILANADVYWDEDILHDILSDDRRAVMLGDESRRLTGDYFFQVVDGCVVKYGKQLPPEDRSTEYVGIAKLDRSFSREFVRHLERLVEQERYELWWENVLYENLTVATVFVRDVSNRFWAEIDSPEDYERILEFVRTGDIACKYGVTRDR